MEKPLSIWQILLLTVIIESIISFFKPFSSVDQEDANITIKNQTAFEDITTQAIEKEELIQIDITTQILQEQENLTQDTTTEIEEYTPIQTPEPPQTPTSEDKVPCIRHVDCNDYDESTRDFCYFTDDYKESWCMFDRGEADLCSKDSDCDDNISETRDKCQGIPKRCHHTDIN